MARDIPSRWGGWLIAAGLAAGGGAGAAPVSAGPPVEHGIAAAQRDYAAVKTAAAAETEAPRLGRPRADEPTLNFRIDEASLAPPGPRAAVGTREEKNGTAATKSKNWLVDAMMEKRPESARDSTGSMARDRNLDSAPRPRGFPGAADARREGSQGALANEKTEPDGKPSGREVPNPLRGYMAAWMTPPDFALLNAAPGDNGTASRPATRMLPDALGGPGLPDFGAPQGGEGGRFSFTPPGDAQSAPKQNPYLDSAVASLAPPTIADSGGTVAGGGGPARIPALVSVKPPVFAEPPAEAKPKPPPGEFLQAQDDAKYFKQLNRF